MKTLQSIDVPSLSTRISGRIRSAILTGLWQPGEQIVESRLAKELGVGQNAVREALQELEFQGLVTKVPNRGNFVTKLEIREIDQIFEFRVEFESVAIAWARQAGRPTIEDRRNLDTYLEIMKSGAENGNFATFSAGDRDFHCALWRLSGNAFLCKALETITMPQFAYIFVRSMDETAMDLPAIVKQHREWLDFISKATPAKAAEYTRKITKSFWQQVRNSIAD